MFDMSAERNEVERPARIDSGGTPPAPVNKVKTASSECSVRVQSGTEWSEPRELPSAGTHRELTAEALRRAVGLDINSFCIYNIGSK